MVGVAERLRRQVVALEIEGSNPSAHPFSNWGKDFGLKRNGYRIADLAGNIIT